MDIFGGSSNPNVVQCDDIQVATSQVLFLYAFITQNTKSTFRLQGASSGYAIPANYKLVVRAIKFKSTSTTTVFAVYPAQSDNDVGSSTATSLTNPVYMEGSGNSFVLAQGYEYDNLIGSLEVAAGKYFSVTCASGTGSVTGIAICELQSV